LRISSSHISSKRSLIIAGFVRCQKLHVRTARHPEAAFMPGGSVGDAFSFFGTKNMQWDEVQV
jgi:hypothetical protein